MLKKELCVIRDTVCMQLLNDLNVGIIEKDVKKIMRLGRF